MSKAEESIQIMKDFFFKLPKDPNYRVGEMGVYEYIDRENKNVSPISLGQRASALMKALNHKINSECRDHGDATDWVSHHSVYPKKILDTAFWFIMSGKNLVGKQKLKPAKTEYHVKVCEDCGKEFGTKHAWAKICLDCYYDEERMSKR